MFYEVGDALLGHNDYIFAGNTEYTKQWKLHRAHLTSKAHKAGRQANIKEIAYQLKITKY